MWARWVHWSNGRVSDSNWRRSSRSSISIDEDIRLPRRAGINVVMISQSVGRLLPQQVAEYGREGFLIYPEAVFPQKTFDGLKEHFEQKLNRLPDGYRPEAMDVPHFTDTKLFEWLFSDEVLDLVEPITGPDIALFSIHFICKPRGNGKRVPWHEDSAYWKGIMEPMEVVT